MKEGCVCVCVCVSSMGLQPAQHLDRAATVRPQSQVQVRTKAQTHRLTPGVGPATFTGHDDSSGAAEGVGLPFSC